MDTSAISSLFSNLIIALMPLAGMMLICYSGYQLWRDLRGTERKKIQERLREDDARRQTQKLEQSIRKQNPNEKTFFELLIGRISLTGKIDRWIEQANVNFTAARFLRNVGLATLAAVVIPLLLKLPTWLTCVLPCIVFYLPIWVLRFKAQRRMAKLVNQLPDVFDLISQALRAGHSLASGVQLIGKQLPDPAGLEFSRIFYEQNLGIKIEEALTNFANRTDQLDIRFFVTAVLIQRQTGGDLAEILDKISDVIRERIKIMGQVKALTAEGRLSGWVLGIMPFFVFAVSYFLNPEYASVLLYERSGQMMLVAALFFEIVGALVIKKIVNIKI